MDNAAVAFCFDALRHCYHVLGKDRFQAETEFIMKCYAKTEYNTNLFNCTLPSMPFVPVEQKPDPEAAAVANQVIVPVEQKPEPEVKSVAIKKPVPVAQKTVPEVQKPEPETKKTGKWQRTPLSEEQRCQRVLPYNGGQCTFKKEDSSQFCSRHKDK